MEYTFTPNTADHEGEQLFLIEGTVQDLQIAHTTVNLLEQIKENNKGKQTIAGAVLAANDMYGMAANAASLIFYDGEDMDNFACYIGDELVGGIFSHPLSIANGDHLKAVVSRRGNMYFVHGLARPADHSAWMPINTFQGQKAMLRKLMKFPVGWGVFMGLISSIVALWIALEKGDSRAWWMIPISLVLSYVIHLLDGIWSYKSFKDYGKRAAAIFTVFGFPDPDDFDLKPSLALKLHHAHINAPAADHSFNYVIAIQKHCARRKTGK